MCKVFIDIVLFIPCIQLGFIDNHGRYAREDSSASDDGGDSQSTIFIIGSGDYMTQTPVVTTQCTTNVATVTTVPLVNTNLYSAQSNNNIAVASNVNNFTNLTSAQSVSALSTPHNFNERLVCAKDCFVGAVEKKIKFLISLSDFWFSVTHQHTQKFLFLLFCGK